MINDIEHDEPRMHLRRSNERLPVKNTAHADGRGIDEYVRLAQ